MGNKKRVESPAPYRQAMLAREGANIIGHRTNVAPLVIRPAARKSIPRTPLKQLPTVQFFSFWHG